MVRTVQVQQRRVLLPSGRQRSAAELNIRPWISDTQVTTYTTTVCVVLLFYFLFFFSVVKWFNSLFAAIHLIHPFFSLCSCNKSRGENKIRYSNQTRQTPPPPLQNKRLISAFELKAINNEQQLTEKGFTSKTIGQNGRFWFLTFFFSQITLNILLRIQIELFILDISKKFDRNSSLNPYLLPSQIVCYTFDIAITIYDCFFGCCQFDTF